MLHLGHGQDCVALRVHAAVGRVHPLVARQDPEQQGLDGPERPLHGLLVGRTQDPAGAYVRPDHPLDLDQMMVLVDRAVVGGDGLGREERQARDLVASELGHQRGRDTGVGPLHVLAPVRPHRQRHHHVAQHHGHVDRGVGDQRQPERHDRMRVHVQGQGQVDRNGVAEDVLADLDRQDRGVERHHLARPVDHDVPAGRDLLGAGGRAQVPLPCSAGAEPLLPHRPQRRVARHRLVGTEGLPDVLVDQTLAVLRAELGTVQRLRPDREQRLPDRR